MITRDATFSLDQQYRYLLTRTWNPQLPPLLACGANPSKADGKRDDLTVTKLMGFAGRWGFGMLILANCNAYVSTDPRELSNVSDPVGPVNDDALRALASQGQPILCCWGDLGVYRGRGAEVEKLFRSFNATLWCFGLTKRGNPIHPSRIGYSTRRQEWLANV